MAIGLVGKKSGMTRVFTEEGDSVPVTVIEVEPNRITQVKTLETDGYDAVQVTTGSAKQNRVSRPKAGHFAKANTPAGRGLWEFHLEGADEEQELSVGGELSIEQFEAGHKVDVRGVSKGKGYAGTIKRWNFRGQDNSHGNSISHRAPGSIGQCQTPGRVFKGKNYSAFSEYRGASLTMCFSSGFCRHRRDCDCCDHEVIHIPAAFSSSLFCPPCFRRRSMISSFFSSSAQSSGVSPSLSFAFRAAPLSISSFTIFMCPFHVALCKGVPSFLFFVFTSAPLAMSSPATSLWPRQAAQCNGVI